MSITLNIPELKKVSSECIELSGTLDTSFQNIIKDLQDICANVQSTELTESNNNLLDSINNISSGITNNLPKVAEFLNTQIATYEKTNEIAEADLNSLISSIGENIN